MMDTTKAQVMPAKTEQSCSICDGPKASTRYGAVCCPGCAAFFARTVRKTVAYCCPMPDLCSTAFTIRRRCKACRFRKCLDKQMRLPPKHNHPKNNSPKFMAESSSSSALERIPETPAGTGTNTEIPRRPSVVVSPRQLTMINSGSPDRGSVETDAKKKCRLLSSTQYPVKGWLSDTNGPTGFPRLYHWSPGT